jgi:predicted dehydrogenase
MCLDMDEADRLVAAAEAHDRPVKIFENFIFYPPVLKARELVDAGAIGVPQSIRIKSNPARSATAWEIPASATAWRQARDRSGGGPLVFDDGHHKFALAWHFMGDPDEVHAFIGDCEGPDGARFDAQSMISFRFPGNRVGNLEIVYSPDMELMSVHYAQDDRVEITGTAGVLFINGGHGRLGATPPVVLYRDGAITTYDVPSGWEQSFILSTRHFISAVREGRPPVLTAREGRQVLRFALAAEQSAREGRTIRLAG